MTTDVFARFRAIDPARDPGDHPDWDSIGAALLATIDGRTTVMPTDLKEQNTTRTSQKGWRNAWIGAVAFVAVILAGVSVALVTSNTGDDVAAVSGPPFETTYDAIVAFTDGLETGTAEDIHGLFGDGGSFAIVGGTVAETDEVVRFQRAIGVVGGPPESCEENSPTSITCEVALTLPINGLLTGVTERSELLTVRINEEGYISGVSEQLTPVELPYDFTDEWVAWVRINGEVPMLELDPRIDDAGQLSISPEDAADRYMRELNRFLAERNG
jgi:hypothetical protein